ncbi:hypothetical protein ABF200_002296 [Flavobacterium psychrophilum]
MKASELRLGNYINVTRSHGRGQKQTTVKKVNLHYLEQVLNNNQTNYIEPIELNREWLISFGFIEDENEELVLKNDLASIVQTCFMDLWLIRVEMIGRTETITILNEDFLYVHQLQNLYLALTGTEIACKNDIK